MASPLNLKVIIMRKPYLRPLVICISLVLIGTVIYNVVPASNTTQPSAAYPPVKVALATVALTPFAQQVTAVGELEAQQQVDIASEVSGRISAIAFSSGQTVKAGQLLVQLNAMPEQALRIRLQAQSDNAARVYQRLAKLVPDNAATQEQLDAALAARDMALGELRHIDALLAQKSIRAPFTGVIGIRRVHEGQYLNAADPVASLINAQTLLVNFTLAEQHSPDITVGQAVNVTIDAYPGEVFKGRIAATDPLITRARTIALQAILDNRDGRLKAGMFANIGLDRHAAPPVLTIPETAITYTAYGDTVFVARTGEHNTQTVSRVAVKSGIRQNSMVEILEGLHAGDVVVTSGQIKLSDGMAIEQTSEDTLQTTQAAL